MAGQKKSDKRREQRRTAVAAYASARSKPADDCISSDQMARLVEGEMDEQRREELLEHIGWCSRCYDEWLTLKGFTLKKKQAPPVLAMWRLLTTGRGLAYAGSALSVAAAVVVFLNLDPGWHIGGETQDRSGEILRSDRQAVEAPPAAAPSQAVENGEIFLEGEAPPKSRREKTAAAPQQRRADEAARFQELEQQESMRLAPAEEVADGKPFSGTGADVALHDQILQACSRGEKDTAFWQRLHDALLANERGAARWQRGRETEKLVDHIARLAATGDAERLCPRLAELLQEYQRPAEAR